MNLKSKNNTETNVHELIMEVTPEEFNQAVNAVFKKESRRMNIPGFRKGKAPRAFIEKYYGDSVFYEAALDHMQQELITNAVDQSELEVVAIRDLDVEEIGKETGVVIKVTAVTKPEVQVKDYKKLPVTREIVTVSEEEVDAEIDRVRERNARMIQVERPAEDGDITVIDYEGTLDGEPFDGGTGENHELALGSGQFIPGFEEQVIGHSVDEEFDVPVTFPEDYHAEDLAGKEAVFHVKLHEIKMKELPELDDEFVKDVSEFDTVEAYREDLKKHELEHKEEHAKQEMENELLEALIKKTEAVIPQEMISREVNEIIQDFAQRLQSQGMSLEMYMQYTGMDMEKMREQYQQQAENQILLRLGLGKIADLEGFVPEDEEIESEYQRLSERYKMPLEKLQSMVSKENVIGDLKNQKALDFIKNEADLTEITTEEKMRIAAEKDAASAAEPEAETKEEELFIDEAAISEDDSEGDAE